MTPELTALALAGLLQAVQYVLLSVPANIELGVAKTLGPRDPDPQGVSLAQQMSVRTARLHRALANHFEALTLFTIAVIVVTLADRSGPLTAIFAWTYLGARVAYVPAYYFGLVPWRTVIWLVGFTATLLMFVAALL